MAKLQTQKHPVVACPVCGDLIEAVDTQFAYFARTSEGHYLEVGQERAPGWMDVQERKPAPSEDQITLEPCGDRISREQLVALRGQAISEGGTV